MANTPRPAFHFRLFVGWLLLHAGMNQTSSAQIFEYGARAGGLPTSAAQSQGYGKRQSSDCRSGKRKCHFVMACRVVWYQGINTVWIIWCNGFGQDRNRYSADPLRIRSLHRRSTRHSDQSFVSYHTSRHLTRGSRYNAPAQDKCSVFQRSDGPSIGWLSVSRITTNPCRNCSSVIRLFSSRIRRFWNTFPANRFIHGDVTGRFGLFGRVYGKTLLALVSIWCRRVDFRRA